MKTFQRLVVGLCLSATVLTAQVPQLLHFQGRVAADQAAFSGAGQFKFALVNGDGTATYWNHEGSAPGRHEPLSVVPLSVSNGLFNVLLGDTTVSNMAPLTAAAFAHDDMRVRIWFNDGVHGLARLEPDVRLTAVAYAISAAQVPDASVTLAKLAPEVATSLGGWPTGAVTLAASSAQASNLVQAGFAPLTTRLTPAEWQSYYREVPMTLGTMLSGITNVWAGDGLWLWRWGDAGMAGQGARYEPAHNRWTATPTNNAPTFDSFSSFITAHGGDLLVINATMDGLRGSRFNVAANVWEALPQLDTQNFGTPLRGLWVGNNLMVLGQQADGFAAARFETATSQWQPVSTNGRPNVMFSEARIAALPDGLLVLGSNPSGLQVARYHIPSNDWQNLSTNGFILGWLGNVKDIFTGNDWYFFENRMEGVTGVKYTPATDTWLPLSTNGAPAGAMDTRLIWTGSEVVALNISGQVAGMGVPSARYLPAADQWRPMSTNGPVVMGFPQPEFFASSRDILMVRSGDPSKWARYDLGTDRWSPLSGPNLGWEALNAWNGTNLISITLSPPMDQEPMIHIYTRTEPILLFQKP